MAQASPKWRRARTIRWRERTSGVGSGAERGYVGSNAVKLSAPTFQVLGAQCSARMSEARIAVCYYGNLLNQFSVISQEFSIASLFGFPRRVPRQARSQQAATQLEQPVDIVEVYEFGRRCVGAAAVGAALETLIVVVAERYRDPDGGEAERRCRGRFAGAAVHDAPLMALRKFALRDVREHVECVWIEHGAAIPETHHRPLADDRVRERAGSFETYANDRARRAREPAEREVSDGPDKTDFFGARQ